MSKKLTPAEKDIRKAWHHMRKAAHHARSAGAWLSQEKKHSEYRKANTAASIVDCAIDLLFQITP